MDKVEIRVHISAPSAGTDEIYKAQAASYFDFSPIRRTNLAGLSSDHRRDAGSSSAARVDETSDEVVLQTPPVAHINSNLPKSTYIENTQEARALLGSPTFTSPELIRSTIPAKRNHVDITNPTEQEASIEVEVTPPDALIETDSSYLKTPVFDRSTKRVRSSSESDLPQYRVKRVRRKAIVSADVTRMSNSQDDNSHQHASQASPAGHVDKQVGSDSQLPTSYSLSDIPSSRSKLANNSMQRSASDPGPALNQSSIETESPSQAHIARQRTSRAVTNDQRVIVISQDTMEEAPAPIPTRTPEPTTKIIKYDYKHFDTATFTTHITDRLAFLDQYEKMQDVYNPVSITREIDLLERGYWLFTTSTWSSTLYTTFWTFMTQFIEDGGAGWGVWCIHGAETPTDDPSTIKVFCWGEIVKHVYLLLYTASNSAVRKLGLQWIDAAGKVVIQMPSVLH